MTASTLSPGPLSAALAMARQRAHDERRRHLSALEQLHSGKLPVKVWYPRG